MRIRDRARLSFGALRFSAANRDLRLVEFARLTSVTGRWAYTVTFAVFAYRSSGTAGVAVAGIVRLGPAAAAAPFAGSLIARSRLDALLFRGGLVRTAALTAAGCVILAGAASWWVYVLVAVESAVSTLMRPAQNFLLPELARTPAELTATNLALSVIESAGVFLGPLLGALLLHTIDLGAVFVVSAAAYLVSALLMLRIKTRRTARGVENGHSGLFVEAAAGIRAMTADRNVAVIVLLYGAQNLVAGALNVLIVVIALRLLELGPSGVGALTAAVGVGGVIGGALVFARLRRGRHGADLAFGLLLWGIPLIVLALNSSQAAALVLLGVVGVGVTVVDVSTVTLLQRSASDESLSHALGLLQTVFVLGIATGTLLAPLLVSTVGVRGAIVITGALLPLLAAALWPRVRRLDSLDPANPALVALLEAIPIFEPLPEAALEHLANTLSPSLAAADEAVFEQGDRGDAFYVIQEGTVDVIRDGTVVATLRNGAYFGEIALLRDVPRTATVVPRTESQLLRLDRDQFLATVMGNVTSSRNADTIVADRLGRRAGLASF